MLKKEVFSEVGVEPLAGHRLSLVHPVPRLRRSDDHRNLASFRERNVHDDAVVGSHLTVGLGSLINPTIHFNA